MLQFKIIHDCTVIGYRVQLKNQSQADHRTKQNEKPINPIAFEREPDQHNPLTPQNRSYFPSLSQQTNRAH